MSQKNVNKNPANPAGSAVASCRRRRLGPDRRGRRVGRIDAAYSSAARYRWDSSAKLFENALTLAVQRAKEDPIPASAQG
jgi:hypothetical protein